MTYEVRVWRNLGNNPQGTTPGEPAYSGPAYHAGYHPSAGFVRQWSSARAVSSGAREAPPHAHCMPREVRSNGPVDWARGWRGCGRGAQLPRSGGWYLHSPARSGGCTSEDPCRPSAPSVMEVPRVAAPRRTRMSGPMCRTGHQGDPFHGVRGVAREREKRAVWVCVLCSIAHADGHLRPRRAEGAAIPSCSLETTYGHAH